MTREFLYMAIGEMKNELLYSFYFSVSSFLFFSFRFGPEHLCSLGNFDELVVKEAYPMLINASFKH